MRHVWTLRLTLPLLLWTWLRGDGRGSLYHTVEITSNARRLIALASRLGAAAPKVQIDPPTVSGEGRNGACLVYDVERLCLDFARATVAPLVADLTWLPARYRSFPLHWERLLMADLIGTMRDAACLVVHADNLARQTNEDTVCYLSAPVLSRAICRFASPRVQPRLRPWTGLRAVLNVLYPLPHQPSYWMRLVGRAILRRPSARPAMHLSAEAQNKGVILEQAFHWSFKLFPAAGHLYWVEGDFGQRDRAAVFFNRDDTPCDEAGREAAEAIGLGWVDVGMLPDQFDRPLVGTLAILWRMGRAFPVKPNAIGMWRWSLATRTAVRLEGWRMMLRRCNAKALKQHQIFLPETIALALACKMEDVAFVFNFWSIHQNLVAQHCMGMADLLLPWGPYHQGFFAIQGFQYRHMVQVGMIAGDGILGTEAEEAAAIRARLAPQVSFVITLFDTSHHFSAYSSADQVLEFYATALAMVADNPRWGCIIKSKGTILANLPFDIRVQPVLDRLKAAGRCLVLTGWERVSAAATAADLVACSGVNSTGFDAALIGKRAVHLDLSALTAHPVALAGGVGTIIFRSAEDFGCALQKAETDTKIGDHGRWIELIDPFRDGRGRFRVGALLKAYLEARDKGLDRDGALDEAVGTYGEIYGADLVTTAPRGSAISTPGETLWGQSRDAAHPGWEP